MAAQWERLKTGLGIGPEPVQEPESLPSQLLHQLDEATTLSKTQVLLVQPRQLHMAELTCRQCDSALCSAAESVRICNMSWAWSLVRLFGVSLNLPTGRCSRKQYSHP